MNARFPSLILLLISFVATTSAEIPRQMNYQGHLLNDTGSPLTGTFDFTFEIYDQATGGNLLWEEYQTSVYVNDGYFSVILGAENALRIRFDDLYWLQLKIDNETLSPRQALTTVGQSQNARDVYDQNIHPRSISVTGYGEVIDSTGSWVGPSSGLMGPTGPQGIPGPTGPQGDTFWTQTTDDIYYNSGSVGIGLTTPGDGFNSRFDVAGNSSFRTNFSDLYKGLIVDNTGTSHRIYTDALSGTPYNLILGTYPNGHTKQLVLRQSTGAVGINTASPGDGFNTMFDVSGSCSLRTNTSDTYKGLLLDTIGTSHRIYTDALSGTPYNLILGTYPNGHTKQLVLRQSTGAVGINTASPGDGFNTMFDVSGSCSLRTNTSDTYKGLLLDTIGTSHRIYTDSLSGTPYNLILGTYPNGHTKQLVLRQSTGAVGINTASPGDGFNTMFDVSGSCSLRTNTSDTYKGLVVDTIGTSHRIYTDALSGTPYDLILGTYPNGHSNQIFLKQSTGNVGIGTNNPGTYKLYVNGAAYATGGWSGSDYRWKKNIEPIQDTLDKMTLLQGVTFNWRTDEFPDHGFTDEKQIGLIAQDVEKIIPELVRTDEDGFKAISYEKLTVVLLEAIKELKEVVEKQQVEIDLLKSLSRSSGAR